MRAAIFSNENDMSAAARIGLSQRTNELFFYKKIKEKKKKKKVFILLTFLVNVRQPSFSIL